MAVPAENVAPLLSQTALGPVTLWCRRMSDLPPPSTSQLTVMLQPLPGTVQIAVPLEIVVPFMSQIAFWPVTLLRHRMSDLPSPLKSPTPAILQLRSATV